MWLCEQKCLLHYRLQKYQKYSWTLTDFKVEWTDTNTSPLSSHIHVSMADPIRQNSPSKFYAHCILTVRQLSLWFFRHIPLSHSRPDQQSLQTVLQPLSLCSSHHLPAPSSTYIQHWYGAFFPLQVWATLWPILFYRALVGLRPMNYIHKWINLTEQKLDFDH